MTALCSDLYGDAFGVPNGEPLGPCQWDMALINASDSGSYAKATGAGVTVGIIDSGVDLTHPDIAPNLDLNLSCSFINSDTPTAHPAEIADGDCSDKAAVQDLDGHGTHVASSVAAPLNGIGTAGVAPEATIVGLKACTIEGYCFADSVAAALRYAGDQQLDVVNLSLFADPYLYYCKSEREQRAILKELEGAARYAQQRGVTIVTSAGNEQADLQHPGLDTTSPDWPPGVAEERDVNNSCRVAPTELPGVITVSSTGPIGYPGYDLWIADYSSVGMSRVDVAAPGGDYFQATGTAQDAILGAVTSTSLSGTWDFFDFLEQSAFPRDHRDRSGRQVRVLQRNVDVVTTCGWCRGTRQGDAPELESGGGQGRGAAVCPAPRLSVGLATARRRRRARTLLRQRRSYLVLRPRTGRRVRCGRQLRTARLARWEWPPGFTPGGHSCVVLEISRSGQTPELAGQAVGSENRFRLDGRRRCPITLHAARVPILREVVGRLNGHGCPTEMAGLRQPGVELGSRPEAVDGASGETDVVPEPASRHHVMDDSVGRHGAVVDGPDRCVGRGVGGIHHGPVPEHGEDRECVPGAVRPPAASFDHCPVVGDDTGERVRHRNAVLAGNEHDPVLGGEVPERNCHVGDIESARLGNGRRRHIRDAGLERLVDRGSYRSIGSVHGASSWRLASEATS